MEKELQKMYDSEINVGIQSFWDGSWTVWLGDQMNGYIRPKWDNCELDQVIPALQELIKEHLPESSYAKGFISPSM